MKHLYLLHLYPLLAIAFPTLPSSLLNNSQLLSSTSSLSNPPPDFTITFSSTPDFGPPLPEIPLYTLALTALSDLCFRDQNAYLPGSTSDTWMLPTSQPPQLQQRIGIYTTLSARHVRYAVWGLQATVGAARSAHFAPMIGRVFWKGEFAGRVDVGNLGSVLPSDDDDDASEEERTPTILLNTHPSFPRNTSLAPPSTNHTSPLTLPSTPNTNTPLTTPSSPITISPHHTSPFHPLSPRTIFGTAINVVVAAAEAGPNTYCAHFTRPEIEIRSAYDMYGRPLLRYRYLVRAMGEVVRWMGMGEVGWGECEVEVWRGGRVVGWVRFRSRGRGGRGGGGRAPPPPTPNDPSGFYS